jgi:hypothetical protein
MRGSRVTVTRLDGSEIVGVLQGLTADTCWVDLTGVPLDQVEKFELTPLFCSNCLGPTITLFDELCAGCYRKAARLKPTPQEPCEQGCGRAGVRNPGTDEFLCPTHHAEAGNRLQLHGEAINLIAECYTDDVTSNRHEWGQVRGARFRCIRCRKAEKWDTELLRERTDGS